MEKFDIGDRFINLVHKDKIAYDDDVQTGLKNFMENEFISQIPEDSHVLEDIVNEITEQKLSQDAHKIYDNLDVIVQKFREIMKIGKIKKKISQYTHLEIFYIERLQNLFIEIGKNKLNTCLYLIKALDKDNKNNENNKEIMVLDDNRKSLALYILVLTLLKQEYSKQ